MVRKINNRLYKVNTYASAHIIEVDDNYDEEVQKLRKEIQLDSIGYKLNLYEEDELRDIMAQGIEKYCN